MKNKTKGLLIFIGILVLLMTACTKEETTTTMDLTNSSESKEAEIASKNEQETEVTTDFSGLVKAYFNDMPDHIYKIGEKEFVEQVQAGQEMVILDIRSEKDYLEGHVKGAINIPWGAAIGEALTKLPQEGDVFVYCYTGQTAGQAVATLNLAGVPARSVNFGWNLGISKVEGVEAVTETQVNELSDVTYAVKEDILQAILAYYNGLAQVGDSIYKNYKIDEDELKQLIDANEDIYILSARKAEDYAKAHIPGAKNIPFGKTFADDLSQIPMDKKVIVYCYSGQTAGQATAALRLLGYDAVSLNAGMGVGANAPAGWMNKGYDVVGTSEVTLRVGEYFTNMPEHIYKISEKEFVEKVIAGEELVILDIRSEEDYLKGHVKGAISVPWGTAIAEKMSLMSQDEDVFIYCYSGQTAGQAVVTMNIAGVKARSVNLGWNFGISKVEGIETVTETTVNVFDGATHEISESVMKAVQDYYEGLAVVNETPFKFYKISEDNLAAMFDTQEDITVLSARKAEDYEKGHIATAINAPFGKDVLSKLVDIPMDKKVVVYCYTGQTAGQLTAAMRLLGYDAVSLNGGVGTPAIDPNGWINKGYELVTN